MTIDTTAETAVSPTEYAVAAMGEDQDSGRRRIVLHPRTAAARRVDRRRSYGSHVRGFAVQNDEVFDLVDDQRRAAVRYLVLLLTPLTLLLASLVFAPDLTDYAVRGVPLRWLLLGPITLFSIVLIAWRHDQSALRKERNWASIHQDEDP